MNVDGVLNSKGAGIKIVLATPEGSIIEQSFTLGFLASNNEAKYEAILVGFQAAITLRVKELEVRCDFSLIVNQVSSKYVTRDSRTANYLQLVLKLKSKIPRCDFKWFPRSANNYTDSLANVEAAVEFQFRWEIPIKHITNPSVQQPTGEVLRFDTLPG